MNNNQNWHDPVEARDKIEKDTRWWAQLTERERQEIEFKMTRSVMQLVIHFPFFGFIAAKLTSNKVMIKEESQLRGMGQKTFKTMATDGKRLYIWPQFVLYNDVEMLIGVIMHEIFHVMLIHLARAKGYNLELANIAMDLTVNMMVNDIGREMEQISKTQALDERTMRAMPWYVPCPPGYYDEQWRDKNGDSMQWEKIYEALLKMQSKETQKRMNEGQSLSEACGGQTPKGLKPGQGMTDSHDFWNPGERPADEEGEVNTDRFDPQEAQDMIRDAHVAATNSKMRGSMPASMQRLIDEWLTPPLPWQRLVQKYLKPVDGWFGYEPGDMRFDDPIPWFIPEHKLRHIVICVDTSGSMSDQEVAAAIDQSRTLLRSFPQTKGILCQCDAAVSYWEDIKEVYTINRRHGYGGTSFHPPFQEIIDKKIVNETDLLIYFTDGYGAFPDDAWLQSHKIPFDTLWVITNDDVKPPDHRQYRWTRLNPRVTRGR